MKDNILEELKALSTKHTTESQVGLPNDLCSRINKNGITLFKLHKIPSLKYEWEHAVSSDLLELRAGLRWGLLADEKEEYWREQTTLLLSGDLTTLQPGGSTVPMRVDNAMAHTHDSPNFYPTTSNSTSTQNNNDMPCQETPLHSTVPADIQQNTPGHSTPILSFLLQRQNLEADHVPDFDAILAHIAVIRAEHPDMTLKCRRSGMRIDYNPVARDVTSIHARLSAAATRSLTAKHIAKGCKTTTDHFEYLQRPPLFFNRSLAAFESLKHLSFSAAERGNFNRYYRSLFDYLGARKDRKWQTQFPLSPSTKVYIVRSLLFVVRKRATSVNPNHELLATNRDLSTTREDMRLKVQRWGIRSDTAGFAAQLIACFDRDGLSSAEYEDLPEQKLWALNCSSKGLLRKAQQGR